MEIINADCIEAMKQMADNSVDAIVTDPPYELGFMGKSWDASGIAFNVQVWEQALRVLKPGGHLIAFSGSRTYHRMAVAIEDAGFEIRDQIMWVYGSGFPKSLNISKSIDKAAGAEREVIGTKIASPKGIKVAEQRTDIGAGSFGGEAKEIDITAPATDDAKQWDGWGTALKPAHEPMVLARKPIEGTVANNVLTYGTGGLNIDASRVASDDGFEKAWDKPVSTNISAPNGKFITEGSQHTVDLSGNRPVGGRFPANFIHDGSDEVVALFPDTKSGSIKPYKHNNTSTIYGGGKGLQLGTITANFTGDSGSAARFFYCAKASKRDRNEGLDGFEVKEIRGGGGRVANGYDETTKDLKEAARKYGAVKSAKANTHPTVKPTTLMQYLVRLVTPPKGVILDPFMGSGSTGKAAIKEGFEFIGIDQSLEYCDIARARIEYAQKTLPEFEQDSLL